MLKEEKTYEQFNYRVEQLSKGSNKRVVLICDYCGREYSAIYKQYIKSHDIIDKDACIKCKYEKRKDISLKLYGVENSAQRPDVRKKISEKCEGFDDKRKQTMIERYGTDKPMLSEDLRCKQKQSVRDKYGVDNVSQIPEVKEKREQTNLQKFGHKQFLASEEGKQKKIDSMIVKYGVVNAFQSEEVKQKIKDTNLKKYGVDHHFKDKQKAEENAKKVIQSKINNGTIKLYDGKPISEWVKISEYSNSRFRSLVNKHGFETARTMSPRFSSLEQLFEKWLIEEKIEYQKQFRIHGVFADFLLPDYNIIIELDGLYWHCELRAKDDYHVNKRFLYKSLGYIPLFFREDEIESKFPIIKSIIFNKMKKSNRIFARKCDIIKLDKDCGSSFFEDNHLMGKGSGEIYALRFDDQIVSAISVRKIKDSNYEISRFCHKQNVTVVGGFSRLVKYAIEQLDIEHLKTFVDQRYGDGSYLKDLGFEFVRCGRSFAWTNCNKIVHRLRFPGNSGYDYGFVKIWDCGQARYDLDCQQKSKNGV